MLQRNARTQCKFICTGKRDTICIYDTSDRSKQKLPVDVETSFFLTSEMTFDFFGYLMLIKIKYGRHTNRRIRAHESDSEVTVRRLGKIIQRIFFAQSGASIRRVAWKWSGETVSFPRGSFTFIENFRSYITSTSPLDDYYSMT